MPGTMHLEDKKGGQGKGGGDRGTKGGRGGGEEEKGQGEGGGEEKRKKKILFNKTDIKSKH